MTNKVVMVIPNVDLIEVISLVNGPRNLTFSQGTYQYIKK